MAEKIPKTQETKQEILVADDVFVNRALLGKAFSDDYTVLLAENGKEAVELLRANDNIAAVLLDIMMPLMDGYEVLDEMQSDSRLKKIPVVVVTGNDDEESQIKALDHGAQDVISKPFNPKIVRHRVNNIIERQAAARLSEENRLYEQKLRLSEIDEKTGIYTKQAFCRKTSEYIKAHPEEKYVICRWDIDNFKVYNDVFGVAEGDFLLAKIAKGMQRNKTKGLISYGHLEADHFVACIQRDTPAEKGIEKNWADPIKSLNGEFDFVPRTGVYAIEDVNLDVSLMCDRALLALRSIKNDYTKRVAYYDETMRAALLEEQEIIGDMDRALQQGQFVAYFQPQCNYASNSLHGAEALVRWKHPEKGLIPPDRFIPIFERNGFITKLDEYVWEEVCRLQRKWLDMGIQVVPISVNISRRDIYNSHLCEFIIGLAEKYRLSPSLLRLEITESAYMENADLMIKTVERLRAAGFALEMDDFGSGYSSLNTLKEVPVDMLKLDMKFLGSGIDDEKGGSILTSVIRMAHWIKLPVIAEGVETKEQAEYLKSVGCIYIQGYYFSKPIPEQEYEEFLKKSVAEGESALRYSDNIRGAENFLSASAQGTLLFNSFVGGAAIIEYDSTGNVEALRLNDRFFETIGTTREEYMGKQLHILGRFDEANRKLFLDTIEKAIYTKKESGCELQSKPFHENGMPIWLRLRMRLLSKNIDRYILYMSVENVSDRVQLSEQLTAVMGSVPGGIIDLHVTDHVEIEYFNDRVATMFGYTREEYQKKFVERPFDVIHQEDKEQLKDKIEEVLSGREQMLEADYRHRCADGSWRWVRLTGQVARRQNNGVFASGILMDIDSEVKNRAKAERQSKEIENQRASIQAIYDTIPCGILQFENGISEENTTGLISFNDAAWKLYGYSSREQYIETVHGKSKLMNIYPEDLPEVLSKVEKLESSPVGTLFDIEHRIIRHDGGVLWVRALLQKIHYTGENDVIQVIFSDITERKLQDVHNLNDALLRPYDEVFELDYNRKTCFKRMSKYPNDPMVGRYGPFENYIRELCKYVSGEEEKKIREFYTDIRGEKNKIPRTLEICYSVNDGESRWALLTVVYISDGVFLSCNKDTTEEKNAKRIKEENRELKERIR